MYQSKTARERLIRSKCRNIWRNCRYGILYCGRRCPEFAELPGLEKMQLVRKPGIISHSMEVLEVL